MWCWNRYNIRTELQFNWNIFRFYWLELFRFCGILSHFPFSQAKRKWWSVNLSHWKNTPYRVFACWRLWENIFVSKIYTYNPNTRQRNRITKRHTRSTEWLQLNSTEWVKYLKIKLFNWTIHGKMSLKWWQSTFVSNVNFYDSILYMTHQYINNVLGERRSVGVWTLEHFQPLVICIFKTVLNAENLWFCRPPVQPSPRINHYRWQNHKWIMNFPTQLTRTSPLNQVQAKN